MIRKQQGDQRWATCPPDRPSLFPKAVKSIHIRCAARAAWTWKTTLMLVKQNAPIPLRDPGHVSRAGQPKASPCRFPGLVVIAIAKLPIPSRTRPISATTPMVLRLKTWESRSPPNLISDNNLSNTISKRTAPSLQKQSKQRRGPKQPSFDPEKATPSRTDTRKSPACPADVSRKSVAGWSSPVARQAHNLKVTGSNPVPATKSNNDISMLEPDVNRRVCAFGILVNTWSTFDESLMKVRELTRFLAFPITVDLRPAA